MSFTGKKKKAKRSWYTLQLIPHGNGKVKTYKFKFVLLYLFLCCLLMTFAVTFSFNYYFWHKKQDLENNIYSLYHVQNENKELNEYIKRLETEFMELHSEIKDIENWMQKIKQLESEIKLLDTSANLSSPIAQSEQYIQKRMVKISSDGLNLSPADLLEQIYELRSKISQLKMEMDQQETTLVQIKDHLEEELYLAQFVPSIPPATGRYTSPFGWRKDPINGQQAMHAGTDIASFYGAPIHATAKGSVVFAGTNGGHGNRIIIDHGNGYRTSYSHLSKIEVKIGDQVNKADIIGRMGNTGRVTGTHIHYEIHKNGSPVNPNPYMKGDISSVEKEKESN